MLQPKKTKFRKAQKGRMNGLSQRGHQLSKLPVKTKFVVARDYDA